MTDHHYTLFETPIGPCGIVWADGSIIGTQLPEADARTARARLRRRFPDAREASPPPVVEEAVDLIVRLLGGQSIDLGGVPLDMSGVPAFERRVYEVTRAIPRGRTLTYGEVAAKAGEPGAAQAVGQALGRNPFPIIVPCHRVLAAGGKLHGFSAHGGIHAKRRLLEIEDARTSDAATLFDFAAAQQAAAGSRKA
jgi:methylated-DNA-[protein]-cysteine S-methyltransferase